MHPRRMLVPVVMFVGAGALLYSGAVIWSGAPAVMEAAMGIGPAAIMIGAALSLAGYLARFARWHMLLTWFGHRLPIWFNLRVYLAGLALTTTPGKLGETIRSLLLLPRGVGIAHSFAAFFVDRLSDVVGVALLGVLGGWIAGRREIALEILALCVIALALLARGMVQSRYWTAGVKHIENRGLPGRWIAALARPASVWAESCYLRRDMLCVICGFVAFGLQGVVFANFADLAGAPLSTAQCIAIFASATLIGAASMIPAGLGTMEAALVYQLVGFGVAAPDAIAMAIVTRVSTLWCGLLVGSIALLSFARNADAGSVQSASPWSGHE